MTNDPDGRLFQTAGTEPAGVWGHTVWGSMSWGSGATATSQFLYDGDALVAEYAASGTLLRRYVNGPDTDEPMVWYEGSGLSDRRFLHADHQGSVVAVSNSAGAATTINSYDEYGIPGTSNAGRFQYTGQIWLPELGLYHYKARAYSPILGRFMQTDPVGYDDQMNLYAYVGNDPVNGADPSGMLCGPETGTLTAGGETSYLPPITGHDCDGIITGNLGALYASSGTGPRRGIGTNGGLIQVAGGYDVGPHHYDFSIPLCLGCSTQQAFDVVRSFSAPGAGYAQNGTHKVTLAGNNGKNQIIQTVDPNALTITNTTLPGHVFYPGTVQLSVTQDQAGVVSLHVVGQGTGAYSTDNQIFGPAIFSALGLAAYGALNPDLGVRN